MAGRLRLYSDTQYDLPEGLTMQELAGGPWPDEPTYPAARLGASFAGEVAPADGPVIPAPRTSASTARYPLMRAGRNRPVEIPRARARLSRAERRAVDEERALLIERRLDLERRCREFMRDVADLRHEVERLARDRRLLAVEREALRAERMTLAEQARQLGK